MKITISGAGIVGPNPQWVKPFPLRRHRLTFARPDSGHDMDHDGAATSSAPGEEDHGAAGA